jgi:hypothetical protein
VLNRNQIKTFKAYQYMLHNTSHTKEKVNQALEECASWLTMLNHLKEESYSLKTKLSEALDNNADKELLAEAENFHNLIIIRDEYIRDIAMDTRNQEKKLTDAASKPLSDRLWIKPQQKLRNEITYLKKDFANMRDDFYHKFLKKSIP